MKISKLPQVDMTSGRILSNIIAFAIPLILTSYLQLLYNPYTQSTNQIE